MKQEKETASELVHFVLKTYTPTIIQGLISLEV